MGKSFFNKETMIVEEAVIVNTILIIDAVAPYK